MHVCKRNSCRNVERGYMKAGEVIDILEKLSPRDLAMDWDNTGLLVGGREKEVSKCLIAVDATDEVIEEAVKVGADMLITHHPLIFKRIAKINEEDFIGRRIIKLIKSDICLYCMHTNFDIKGMADEASDILGLKNAEVLELTSEGDGLGRMAELDRTVSAKELAELVKEKFALDYVCLYAKEGQQVRKAAIYTGSGKGAADLAINADCDALITGDIDYHTALDAMARDMCIIDAGHFGIEKIFIPYIAGYLEENCKGPEIIKSGQKNIGVII